MKKFIYFLILLVFAFTSCEQDEIIDPTSNQEEELNGTTLKGKMAKVDVCHYDAVLVTWESLNINGNSLNAHLNHGDVSLVDADGDGYVVDANECAVPSGDCDDTNADVNPGMDEICDNGIDDNCNGVIDDGCFPCDDPYSPEYWQGFIIIQDCLIGGYYKDNPTAQIRIDPDDGIGKIVKIAEGVFEFEGWGTYTNECDAGGIAFNRVLLKGSSSGNTFTMEMTETEPTNQWEGDTFIISGLLSECNGIISLDNDGNFGDGNGDWWLEINISF